jgi:hypothetical protein
MSMQCILKGPAFALALLAGGQAMAQTAPAPQPTPAPAAVAAPDPARMAIARQVAAKLLPLGSYKKMMGQGFDQLMASMTGSMMDMPVADLAKLGGLEEDKVRELGEAKLSEVMAIYDPHWRDRMKLSTDAGMELVLDIMTELEPRMQEAMARVYARDFAIAQLGELNAFLSSPTGVLYADKALAIFMDPEVMKEMAAMMPAMMERMPAFMEKMQEAEAGLPPRRKIADLSDADRNKLAELLGVKVEELDDPEKVTQ